MFLKETIEIFQKTKNIKNFILPEIIQQKKSCIFSFPSNFFT